MLDLVMPTDLFPSKLMVSIFKKGFTAQLGADELEKPCKLEGIDNVMGYVLLHLLRKTQCLDWCKAVVFVFYEQHCPPAVR
jgi:hypothetical protein